ncbi:unnamed protein product [Umbelopsis sp. WA50703]
MARKHYLLAHTYLAQVQCEWFNKADLELQALDKMLHAKDEGSIQSTQGIGKVVDDAFDENINRILTSQTPPRPIILPSHQEALESLVNLTTRLASLCTIVNYKTATSLLNFCKYFASTRPYPDAFSRSKLNTSIYHNHRFLGSRPLEEVVAESIKDLIQPPTWWFSKERPSGLSDDQYHEAKKAITMFLERAGLPFLDIFRIYCHNRARQRRIMSKILGEWEVLLNEAAALDGKLNDIRPGESKFYFYHWVNHRRLNMIETILMNGFELELYGPHEYTMIYWFADYLMSYRYNTYVQLLESLPAKTDNSPRSTPASPSNNGQREFEVLHELNSIKQALNLAVLRAILAFEQLEIIKKPKLAFDDEETRYRHRFKAFADLWNFELPPFDYYKSTTNTSGNESKELLLGAKWSFGAAQDLIKRFIRTATPENTKTELCADAFKEVGKYTLEVLQN